MKNFRAYNTTFIEQAIKNGRKLVLTGAIMVSAMGLTACSEDVSLNSSYSTEMEANFENYNDYEQECSLAMQNYLIAKDEYEQDKNVENRVSLVSASRAMRSEILNMTKQKARDAINLDDNKDLVFNTDLSNVRFFVGNKGTYNPDGSLNDFIEDSYKADGELRNLAEALNRVSIYKGNGESETWERSMNDFIKSSDDLYKEATGIIGNSFSMNDDKISVSKEKSIG